jgi:ferredoxin--NADP+ reductase
MADQTYTIAVLGAGPAAIYGADKLAEAGHEIVMLNRDIKPGGLAEFGIYPNKHRMKNGLRTMFRRILAKDNIEYYGNIKVGEGEEADIAIDEIQSMGVDATVVAVGAQGTRWLGLPGEEADAVHHAKDIVYHFNKLPPFSEREYPIGDDVCVVGLGNVCLDMVHWLTCEKKVDSVTAVYRRGPAERPCTSKELKIVSGAMDLDQIREEIESIREDLEAVGQDPEEEFEDLTSDADEPLETESPSDFRFRFLRNPERIEVDDDGQVTGLVVEKTELVPTDDEDARPDIDPLGETETIPCDTVIFAIGDKIDPSLGLPLNPEWEGEFATVPEPWDAHPDRPRYTCWDPAADEPLWGTFVIGWARKASDGLVGKAKQDAERGCDEILAYLDGELEEGPGEPADVDKVTDGLTDLFRSRGVRYVTFDEVQALEDREDEIAEERDLKEFKFETNEKMLEVLEG